MENFVETNEAIKKFKVNFVIYIADRKNYYLYIIGKAFSALLC